MEWEIDKIIYFKHTQDYRIVYKSKKTGDTDVQNFAALNPKQLAFIAAHQHTKQEGSVRVEWSRQ